MISNRDVTYDQRQMLHSIAMHLLSRRLFTGDVAEAMAEKAAEAAAEALLQTIAAETKAFLRGD